MSLKLLASFPLGCCCVPPANPSSQQAASASKVAGMPRPLFMLIESRPLHVTPPRPRPALQHIYIYIYILKTTLRLDYLPRFPLGNYYYHHVCIKSVKQIPSFQVKTNSESRERSLTFSTTCISNQKWDQSVTEFFCNAVSSGAARSQRRKKLGDTNFGLISF